MPRVVSTVVGTGIGIAAGIGVGAIADAKWNPPGTDDPGLFKGVFGTLGLIAGAGIGLGGRFATGKCMKRPDSGRFNLPTTKETTTTYHRLPVEAQPNF